MTRTCETCRHHLGGDECAQNLELECAAGEYEAWEGKVNRESVAIDRIKLAYEALQQRAPGEKLYVAY